jgi:16S rRNA (guanine527-N7)-methyltransferase
VTPSATLPLLRDIAQRVLGAPLAPGQEAALENYLALLDRWNATYNLTAVRDPAQRVVQHLGDCLAIVPALRRRIAELPATRLLDVGSGGGLPGLVVAVMLPGLEVTCVDSVGKKAAFVRQAAGELGLANLRAEHARVESLRSGPYDLITARAFGSLETLVRLTRPALAPGGAWLAMKGRRPDDEIAALPADVEMFHVEPLQVPHLDAERCIVWMRLA